MEYIPVIDGILHGAEQFPWIELIPGKYGMLQNRAVPGQKDTCKRLDAAEQSASWIERFLAKTGCYRAEQLLDSLYFWKRRDAAEQSSFWIERYL